jgi:hypothetical protein
MVDEKWFLQAWHLKRTWLYHVVYINYESSLLFIAGFENVTKTAKARPAKDAGFPAMIIKESLNSLFSS